MREGGLQQSALGVLKSYPGGHDGVVVAHGHHKRAMSAANSYFAADMPSSCCSICLDTNHLHLQRSQINDRERSCTIMYEELSCCTMQQLQHPRDVLTRREDGREHLSCLPLRTSGCGVRQASREIELHSDALKGPGYQMATAHLFRRQPREVEPHWRKQRPEAAAGSQCCERPSCCP